MPTEAEEAMNNAPVGLGISERNGEKRSLAIGATNNQRILLIATTWRGNRMRIITAYPASRKFREFYLYKKGSHENS